MPTSANECNRRIDELIDILQQEKSLILSGQFVEFANLHINKSRLSHEFESIMSQLDPTQSSGVDLEKVLILHKMANENKSLLSAAAQGVRSAQERLRRLDVEKAHLGAYDASGKGIVLTDQAYSQKKSV